MTRKIHQLNIFPQSLFRSPLDIIANASVRVFILCYKNTITNTNKDHDFGNSSCICNVHCDDALYSVSTHHTLYIWKYSPFVVIVKVHFMIFYFLCEGGGFYMNTV